MLVDILKEKKDNIQDSIAGEVENKENVLEELKLIEDFLSKLNDDLYSIRNIEVKPVLEKLYKEENLDKALEEIVRIKKLLVGKIDMNLNGIELTEEQEQFLKELKDEAELLKEDIASKVNEYEKSKGKHEVDKYDQIIDKLEKNITFDSSDLEVLKTILSSEDIDIQDRIKIAKEILNHNKKEETKIIKTDIQDIINLFDKYDFSDTEKDELRKTIKRHKKELESAFDLENAKEILDYLSLEDDQKNKVDIIRRFEKEDLLIITMCSNVDIVRKRYRELMDESIEIYKKEPGFWCDDEVIETPSKGRKKRKSRTKEEIRYEKENALRMKAKKCNYQNSKQNEEFFKEKALSYNFTDERNKTALLKPNYVIRKNYDTLVEYGILAKYEKYHESNLIPSTVFVSSDLREKCDKLIEVGLLNPEIEDKEPNANYVAHNPTILFTLSEKALLKLSVQKQLASSDIDFYRNILGVDLNNGSIKATFVGGANKYGSELADSKAFDEYKKNNSITGCDELMSNYELLEKEYCKLESQNIVSYDENNSFISSLDEKFGIENSKYIYKIGKQSISRLKVIRIYNALKSNNKFNEEDIKTFALLYGTYINPNTYKYVKDMIDNLEVNNGISR